MYLTFLQGPRETRVLAQPRELIFHVDDKILLAIDDAVALHKKGVSFLLL